jgi:DNA-binding NarL/FixJ family response regulator
VLITVVLADDNEDHRTAVRFVLEFARDVVSIVGEAADGQQASRSSAVSGPTS